MSELNEREMERVSGGLTESEVEKAIERLYRIILAKECGACESGDKPGCQATMKKKIGERVRTMRARPLECPLKG